MMMHYSNAKFFALLTCV